MPYQQYNAQIYIFPYKQVNDALLSKNKDLIFLAEECRTLHHLNQKYEYENPSLKDRIRQLEKENEFLTNLINKWKVSE